MRARLHSAGNLSYSVFAQGTATDEAARMARTLAEKALNIDPADPAVQAIVASAYILLGEHNLARSHIERAIKLKPNDYNVMRFAGIVLGYLGDHEEGLRWLDRLSHHDPFSGDAILEEYFDNYYMARRYDESIKVFHGWRNPPPHMYAEFGAACAQLNRMDEARAAIARFEQTRPRGFDAAEVARAHARSRARTH